MDSLQIDQNNNLVLFNNNLQLVSNIDECAQSVKTRIGLYKGEDPTDLERGIDFDNVALGKAANQDYIKDLIRNRILDSEDIQNISALTLDKKDNKLTVNVEAQSTYGVVRV